MITSAPVLVIACLKKYFKKSKKCLTNGGVFDNILERFAQRREKATQKLQKNMTGNEKSS